MSKSKIMLTEAFYENPTEETFKALKDQMYIDLQAHLIPFSVYQQCLELFEKHLTENS